MATRKKSTKTQKEKTVDLQPKGPRNTDPLSGAAGAHPIETGVGAALGGAAAGLAVGAFGGPVGAVIGAAVGGAVAGGLAGKGVGELIDPTTEDAWLREYFGSRSDRESGDTHERYRDAYRYGLKSWDRYRGRKFDEVEPELRSGWTHARGTSTMSWGEARGAVKDAFERTLQLREEQLRVSKTSVQAGDVIVRKEVHTEHRTVDVPVEREEVVIERSPAAGRATGDLKAEEIHIPVREEKVRVAKETVAKEQVRVSKRKVSDNKKVTEDLKREDLVVESEGEAKVRQQDRRGESE
jgi:uncharacterized protein (TIGR02271 family)